ncbi:hypothetical protein [Haloarchaeobius sp. TZWWS8]|uniref:hypothetical protein n=1 Tax=Haloarchaeobius sp. TZWWS8 TaxID=3446121 RepID=UPI003EBE3E25
MGEKDRESPSPEWDEFTGTGRSVSRRAVLESWESCRQILGTDLERTEAVLRAVAAVAATDPAAVAHTAEDVSGLATAEATNVRQQATLILSQIATTNPADVEPAVDDLGVTLTNAPDPPSRRRAAAAIANVARINPFVVRQLADDLVDRLDDEDERVQEAVAIALGRVVLARAFPVDLNADVDEVLARYAGALAARIRRSVRLDELDSCSADGAELDEVLDELAGYEDLQTDLGVVLDAVDVAAAHGGVAPEPLRELVDVVGQRVETAVLSE